LWLPSRLNTGIETPFGTILYSWNFEESTSSRPSRSSEALPLNQFSGVTAGAVWAKRDVAVARRPQARSTVTIVIRFMAYLPKYAPDGWLEPWSLTWHIRQLRSIKREFTVG
jgi:hypothetical protein